jgi:formamidopyrimidine-DNA glycosylase
VPELPEVENVGRAMRQSLAGRRLDGLDVSFPGILVQSPRRVRAALVGKTLAEVHRHGKYLILHFRSGSETANLMIHLRMTGQLFILDGFVPDQHVHLTFDFEGRPVHYRDIRKFGRLELVDDPRTPTAIAHVGPDMLDIRLNQWLARIAHRGAPIKALLLDQGIAAGLGNIYVDESLFLAGVNPLSRPRDLDRDTLAGVLRRARQVLRLAINHGGTTFLNFTDFHGKPGNFRRKLRVYGRSGQPCRDCQSTLEGVRVAGRSSVFCPRCQPTA